MGWSCRADAAKTLDAWTAKCLQMTETQNVFIAKNGTRRMFEVNTQKEHDDGAITGTYGYLTNDDRYYHIGYFRIDGDGTVARGVGL